MILYILRHAEAEPKNISDFERKLTAHGRKQARRIGRFCKKYKMNLEIILTSPMCRALETAQQVSKENQLTPLLQLPWMASGMPPELALSELQPYITLDSVLFVGHEPDLSQFIALLLGMKSSESVDMVKAAIVAIEIQKLVPGGGVLKFFLPSELASDK